MGLSIKGGKIITQDSDYYLVDVVFLVEDSLFRVPRILFELNSEVFRDMFELPVPEGTTPDGSSDEQPLRFDGIEKKDFRQLLRVLFSRRFSRPPETMSQREWFSVLKLSLMWHMDQVKDLAIENITSVPMSTNDCIDMLRKSTLLIVPKIRDKAIRQLTPKSCLPPVNRILLARECRVADWLLDGYTQLVRRDETISAEDEMQLGATVTLRLFRVRDQHHPSLIRGHLNGPIFDVDNAIRTQFATELKAAAYTHGSYISAKPRVVDSLVFTIGSINR